MITVKNAKGEDVEISQKPCLVCEKEYDRYSEKTVYCSIECKALSLKAPVKKRKRKTGMLQKVPEEI